MVQPIDPIEVALGDALARWRAALDVRAIFRDLLRVVAEIDD